MKSRKYMKRTQISDFASGGRLQEVTTENHKNDSPKSGRGPCEKFGVLDRWSQHVATSSLVLSPDPSTGVPSLSLRRDGH